MLDDHLMITKKTTVTVTAAPSAPSSTAGRTAYKTLIRLILMRSSVLVG